MLVDFTHSNQGQVEKLPEIPVCKKTDLLVRDGRTFADFATILEGLKDSCSALCGSDEHAWHEGGIELLRQLL